MFKFLIFYPAFIAAVALALTTAAVVNAETRIIGGKEADITSHSHLCSIRYRRIPNEPYLHKCAGSIYSETVIITAAQCIKDIGDEERLMIVVGSNTRTGVDGHAYPVKKWIYHANYSFWTIDYDIGILMLDIPLRLNDDVSTIKVRSIRPAVGKYGTIAGWGYREEYGPSSYKLVEARVPIVSSTDCTKAYGTGEITERMICAGFINAGGIDACQGDTGGPLVVEGELVGLVSWGRGCARPGYPGVYTFVGSLKKWIDDTIAAYLNEQQQQQGGNATIEFNNRM